MGLDQLDAGFATDGRCSREPERVRSQQKKTFADKFAARQMLVFAQLIENIAFLIKQWSADELVVIGGTTATKLIRIPFLGSDIWL